MRRWWLLLLPVAVAVAVAAALALSRGGSSPTAATSTGAERTSPAADSVTVSSEASSLAALGGGSPLAIQKAMDRLATRCKGPEVALAGLVWGVEERLQERGRDEPLPALFDHLAASIPAGAGKVDCTRVAEAWLRSSDSHS